MLALKITIIKVYLNLDNCYIHDTKFLTKKFLTNIISCLQSNVINQSILNLLNDQKKLKKPDK